MLFCNVIKPDTLGTLRLLQAQAELVETRLVGGTALALLMGHRLSVDLDIFGVWDAGIDLSAVLGRCGIVNERHIAANVNVFELNGIKVDVVHYPYTWLRPVWEVEGVRLAQYEDIAAMKLEAITNRGSRKDFIDLAFLLQRYSLEEMLTWYQAKYPQGSAYLVLRSLAYFEDAEEEPQPVMLQPLSWAAVKAEISAAVRAFA